MQVDGGARVQPRAAVRLRRLPGHVDVRVDRDVGRGEGLRRRRRLRPLPRLLGRAARRADHVARRRRSAQLRRPEDVRLGDLEPLARPRYGAEVVRQAWAISQANSVAGGGFAPGLRPGDPRRRGGPGFAPSFGDFTAATAEWDAANSGIHEGATFPRRSTARGTLARTARRGDRDGRPHRVRALRRARRRRRRDAAPDGRAAGRHARAASRWSASTATKPDARRRPARRRRAGHRRRWPTPAASSRITAVVVNADTSHVGLRRQRTTGSGRRTTSVVSPLEPPTTGADRADVDADARRPTRLADRRPRRRP